jgi:hypothetical protein
VTTRELQKCLREIQNAMVLKWARVTPQKGQDTELQDNKSFSILKANKDIYVARFFVNSIASG